MSKIDPLKCQTAPVGRAEDILIGLLPCEWLIFVLHKSRNNLDDPVLGAGSEPDGARQANRLAIKRIGIRGRRTGGIAMSTRTVNRLPKRASLDILAGQLLNKLPRV
jgi:hypothetical protein